MDRPKKHGATKRAKNNWLASNRLYRPGNTLFVNGVRDPENKSGLDEAWTVAIEAVLADEYKKKQATAVLDTIGPQTERIGLLSGLTDNYVGYRAEPSRPAFRHLKGEGQ